METGSDKKEKSKSKSILDYHPVDTSDDLPSYKEATQDDGSAESHLAQDNSAQEQQPPCSHWSESKCRITVRSRKCCSCIDERPETESSLYPMFVDGQGWVEKAERWHFYCPGCREYFDPNAKARLFRDQLAWAEKRAKSLAEERDQRYFGLGRWIEATKRCFTG
ncbi:hypothetical protein GGR52DRAFT_533321 [Hypoxylon sp. FL1284]|nr:hypothetical protein GGR52DRAFT_533321 [Hypoxylon sp. FL1284]